MTTLYATFDGSVLRPDEPLELPPNTRVRLTIEPSGDAPPPRRCSFLDTARGLNLAGPTDWSARLDDYLYGDREHPGG